MVIPSRLIHIGLLDYVISSIHIAMNMLFEFDLKNEIDCIQIHDLF
jgi:hypothetical protein